MTNQEWLSSLSKDEMIEKMAKVLCDNDKRCEECISRLLLPCGYKSYCTKLYNAGYRKVGKGKIVVKKSKIGMLEKTIDYLEMEKAQLYKQREQAEQETAREILQDLSFLVKVNRFLNDASRLCNEVSYFYVDATGNKIGLIKENDITDFIRNEATKYGIELGEVE